MDYKYTSDLVLTIIYEKANGHCKLFFNIWNVYN